MGFLFRRFSVVGKKQSMKIQMKLEGEVDNIDDMVARRCCTAKGYGKVGLRRGLSECGLAAISGGEILF